MSAPQSQTLRQQQQQPQQHILIILYPAQGHILPLLDLAHHLASSIPNLTITITTTPRNLATLSPLLSSSPSIQPLILPFPTYPSLPSHVENAKDLPQTARNFALLIHALGTLESPILKWAQSLAPSHQLTAIIADFFVGWAHNLARDLSIPSVTFCPYGSFSLSVVHCLWRDMPKKQNLVSFPSVPGSPVIPWYQLSSIYRGFEEGDPVWEFVKESFLANFQSWGFMFDSFDALEGVYLDHARRELGHNRIWAIGPLSQVSGGGYAAGKRGGDTAVQAEDLLTWLDGFNAGSVVYVSFGSQVVLSAAQGAAVAAGLEMSGVPFMWCVKKAGPDEEEAVGVVPEGFEERVKGRGVVIRGWAPQVVLLSHESVGFFLTHCGWNSVLEGISAGVTLLTWPMMADQYMNARLVEEEAGVGVRVCEGLGTVPNSEELANIVREAVEDNGKGERARELKGEAIDAVKNGGSSYMNLNGMIEALYKYSQV